MAELMNRDEFRSALEQAIKGKSANKAPFSVAWASGKLSREHLARWAENHYHYVAPSQTIWRTSMQILRIPRLNLRISYFKICMRKKLGVTGTPTYSFGLLKRAELLESV